jgi:flagellar motor component MotA
MAGLLCRTFAPALAAAVLTGPLVLHLAGVDLTLSADTHPAVVALGVGVAAAAALLLASAAGLPQRVARLAAGVQPPEQVVSELAALAGVVRQHGLLHAVVDPRAVGRDVFVAGVQLLLRDADEQLLKATLEAETERIERTRDQSFANAAVACRVGAVAALASLVAAGAIMLRTAAAPATIPTSGATAILVIALFGVAGLAISVPGATLFRTAAARRAFARLAERHAVESVRLGENQDLAERRLRALLPEYLPQAESIGIRRAA